MDDNGNAGMPALSPMYQVATEDSALLIRFVGNTAQVGAAQFKAIDAFQLLAVAEYLKMRGLQTIAMQEALAAEKAARGRIMTPSGEVPIDPSSLREGPRR